VEGGHGHGRQILQGIDGKLVPGRGWRMDVTDESQSTLYVLDIRLKSPSEAVLIAKTLTS